MDGIELPISGDLTGLQMAFDSIAASMERLGQKISASMERASISIEASVSKLAALQASGNAAASATAAAGISAASAGQKFLRVAGAAGAVGHAMMGMVEGVRAVNRISSALAGINLAARLGGWVSAVGGVRAAFMRIPAALGVILRSPVFRRLAVGALAATVAIGGTVLVVRGLRGAITSMGSMVGSVFRAITAGAQRVGGAIKNAFSGLGGGGLLSPLTGLAGVMGVGGALFLAISQFKGAWDSATNFEQTRVRIEQFTGSAKKSMAILNDMADFGIKTPFETPDINSTLEKLMGAGINKGVGQLVKDLGAVSKNGQQLTELGDALAKGFAKGKFQTEELNKFLERGINLMPQFEIVTGKSGTALTAAIEKGLKFDDVTKAIARMSAAGGQFFGMLSRQSLTANGLISTLVDSWNAVRRAFVQPLIDAVKPIIMDLTDTVSAWVPKAEAFGKVLADGLLKAYALIKDGKALDVLRAGLVLAFESALEVMRRGLQGAVAFLATALPPIFDVLFQKFKDPRFWDGLMNIFRSIGSSIGADIKASIPGSSAQVVADMRGMGELQGTLGKLQMSMAGSGVDLGSSLKNALMSGGMAAAQTLKNLPIGQGLVDALQGWKNTLSSADGTILKALQERAKIPDAPAASPVSQATFSDAVGKATAPGVMSLQRLGGGGFGNAATSALLSESRKQTSLHAQTVTAVKAIARSLVSDVVKPKTAIYS